MVLAAVVRKSVTDLTRRKLRAFFTVLTLSIAVASVGIFAVPSLMQQSMDREIASSRLADLTVQMKPLVMSRAQVQAVAALPNVVAVQPKSVFSTRVYVGARRQKSLIIAVPDYARQNTDLIRLKSGSPAAAGTLLTESQNAPKKKFEGGPGATARVIGANGRVTPLRVSGTAHFLGSGQQIVDGGFAVFYARPETVAALSGAPGYTMLAMRLRDTSRPAAERTAAAVRRQLGTVKGFSGFADYPGIRGHGDYPGKAIFNQVVTIMTLVTFLALLSALVLLSNTMTTLIGEQTAEIGAMKALGATRRQIGRIYRRTALMLGVLGAVFGTALGILLSNLVVSFFGSQFFGIDAGVHVDGKVLAASLLVGLVGPPLAALPAIRRASRVPITEALNATGSAVGGQGRLDRALRNVGFLPRSAQIGLRGAVRRKRRTLATCVQVALAVGTLLAMLSLGTAVGNMTHGFFDDSHWDIWAQTYASKPFGPGAQAAIKSVPGVRTAQPVLLNGARAAGKTIQIGGLPPRPLYAPPIVAGRWYTAAEARAHARVAVIGRSVADKAGAGVGDTIRVDAAGGPARLRIVGITNNVLYQGAVALLPLGSLQDVLHTPNQVNVYWIRTVPRDHGAIDRITTRIEDTLGARGEQLTTDLRYVQERDSVAANAGMTTSVTVLGLLIVAISLVGLVNAITMGVIERTREIGMLRCVGARAKDVRRIFSVEGLAVAVTGWLIGIPLGWAMAHGFTSLTASVASIDLSFVFPIGNVAITLVGTVLLALLVLLAPVRRAVRLKPGAALRYG